LLVRRAADLGDQVNIYKAEGATIGSSFLFFFWAAGSLILGLLTLLSRGSKIIVEESRPSRVVVERPSQIEFDDESISLEMHEKLLGVGKLLRRKKRKVPRIIKGIVVIVCGCAVFWIAAEMALPILYPILESWVGLYCPVVSTGRSKKPGVAYCATLPTSPKVGRDILREQDRR